LAAVTEPLARLRSNADGLPPAPAAMAGYLDKVRERAYTITDNDVEALKERGCSEDEIFEQTVGVAIREGLHRIDVARRAIG
jgi:hypothetical protein